DTLKSVSTLRAGILLMAAGLKQATVAAIEFTIATLPWAGLALLIGVLVVSVVGAANALRDTGKSGKEAGVGIDEATSALARFQRTVETLNLETIADDMLNVTKT